MFDFSAIRDQFVGLRRTVNGDPAVFFDGPAGSQVPESVIDAIAEALRYHNANCHGPFATSMEGDAAIVAAREAVSDFVQCSDPDEIVFGPNMTTITLNLSRTLGRTWSPCDEIIVSGLDHDANFTPWKIAAERSGVKVRTIQVRPEDCTLDLDHFHSLLGERTRLVAIGLAANSTGTVNPVAEMFQAARAVGATTFVDAVHMAPHRRLNVQNLHCDFLVCSAYKFFGPHVGILWGRRELLENLQVDKLRPSPNTVPEKWMTGTQNHEGISGVRAAIDYLAGLGRDSADESRRSALDRSFDRITAHEQSLCAQFLKGIAQLNQYRVWGITDPASFDARVPTVSLTHRSIPAAQLAARLGEDGIFCWGGNHYAVPFTTSVGLEPHGTLRIGMLHYNTSEEVNRVLEALARFS
ncbi:cysteine desulfurase-like protein [Planctomicrobium sp. SH668]|uniref:cysteine desulfurase-like protein n=1 Tax=Planctomicrobium sp. SH668 TaxID=3448126 RepID=UPI003F5B8128